MNSAGRTKFFTSKKINFHDIRTSDLNRSQSKRVLTTDQMTDEQVKTAIDSQNEQGGKILLSDGQIVFKQSLSFASNVSIFGTKNGTDLIFDGCDYGIIISGTWNHSKQSVNLSNIWIFHLGET